MVGSWISYLSGQPREFQLLIVDDGSTDQTGTLAEALATQHECIHVLRHGTHRGFGAALRTGLKAARFPLVAYISCTQHSGRYEPQEVDHFFAHIDVVDLITGVRKVAGRRYRLSLRDLIYRWSMRAIFAVRLRDLRCTFALARRAIFARIPIQSDGEFAHTEIIAKANFLGFMMTETPVEYHPSRSEYRDHLLREMYQVFSRPDFGPAFLREPEPPATPVAPEANKPPADGPTT
jgi:glycosyltransferase involved in cell wall biosynthesis